MPMPEEVTIFHSPLANNESQIIYGGKVSI
jgi:hypothetical protein